MRNSLYLTEAGPGAEEIVETGGQTAGQGGTNLQWVSQVML